MTLRDLAALATERTRAEHPNVPDYAVPRKTYTDKTANGLTTAIIDYFKLYDIYATRRSNEGRYRPGMQVEDVVGRMRIMKGRFIPAASTGEGDIEVVYKGRKIEIEIKVGRDKQRENQKAHQLKIEKAGGVYVIVDTWPTFWAWWQKFTSVRAGRTRRRTP
jgi:hypothetical protein